MTTKRHVKILSGILPEKTIKKAIQPYKRLTIHITHCCRKPFILYARRTTDGTGADI
jgi:hypothetical protein